MARDVRVQEQLRELGWQVAVIWGCTTIDAAQLRNMLLEIFPEVAGVQSCQ